MYKPIILNWNKRTKGCFCCFVLVLVFSCLFVCCCFCCCFQAQTIWNKCPQAIKDSASTSTYSFAYGRNPTALFVCSLGTSSCSWESRVYRNHWQYYYWYRDLMPIVCTIRLMDQLLKLDEVECMWGVIDCRCDNGGCLFDCLLLLFSDRPNYCKERTALHNRVHAQQVSMIMIMMTMMMTMTMMMMWSGGTDTRWMLASHVNRDKTFTTHAQEPVQKPVYPFPSRSELLPLHLETKLARRRDSSIFQP